MRILPIVVMMAAKVNSDGCVYIWEPYLTAEGNNTADNDRWRENSREIRNLYTSPEARSAGIVYLDEGLQTFTLSNGASFTVYASPYTPEFCQWAFAYDQLKEDRFNPSEASPLRSTDLRGVPENPVPDFPGVDIMVTHGPPYGIFDQVGSLSVLNVGCKNLLAADARAKPRLHVFGHIHEGYGAGRMNWTTGALEEIKCDSETVLEERCAYYDAASNGVSTPTVWRNSRPRPLAHGEETLFVNASVVTVAYEPINAPWLVDLYLPAHRP